VKRMKIARMSQGRAKERTAGEAMRDSRGSKNC